MGRDPYAQIARGMGCSSESVRTWVEQAEIGEGNREGTTSQEQEENQRLRQQLRPLQGRNEILTICGGLSAPGRHFMIYEFIEAAHAHMNIVGRLSSTLAIAYMSLTIVYTV